jgi:D-aminopeptidase
MSTRRNLITDVPGLAVGHAHDARVATGVTAVMFDRPTVTSASILGGGPATRDTDCLEPHAVVPGIDALVLGGGSGFGLDAASGVQAYLREAGRGFAVGPFRVPVVPQAIVFDLMNGGDKDWGRYPPYRELGYEAASSASVDFALGTVGGGYGATTVDLKGGLGSASAVTSSGLVVGALAIANAIASVVIGRGPHFWAGAFEVDAEFGGLGLPARVTEEDRRLAWKGGPAPVGTATTLALVATDAVLTKAQCKRLAVTGHTGIAKAQRFSHALLDGDAVFASATGVTPLQDEVGQMIELCAVASDCVARAVARAVYEATALPCNPGHPAWRDRFAG